jgi:hypothetical protein
LFATLKPAVRCEVKPVAAVLGAGIVFPGLGHVVTGRPIAGFLSAVATAELAREAAVELHHADSSQRPCEACLPSIFAVLRAIA